jgi:hypothetical protein
MAEIQTVLIRLDGMDTRMAMDVGPDITNLVEAAEIAEERYGMSWNYIQWHTVTLSRDEWLNKRSDKKRKEAIAMMRDYFIGFITGCEEKGMTASEIRDTLCVTMLGG